MTKHRKTKRRSQKGGFWPFTSSDPNSPSQSWGDMFSSWGSKTKEGLNSANNYIGNVASSSANAVTGAVTGAVDVVSSPFKSSVSSNTMPQEQPIPQEQAMPQEQAIQSSTYGGKRRRRRARTMKGGKGGLGLTYYASPVSGLKVAEPTTWQYYANGTNQYSVKGGSRKRRGNKIRKTRRNIKR